MALQARQGGVLDRVLIVRRAATARSAMGTQTPTWDDFLTGVRAGREDVRDAERTAGDQTQAIITHRFTLRWSADRATVDVRDQLVEEDTGQLYAIVAVKEPVRRKWLEFSATALQGMAAA